MSLLERGCTEPVIVYPEVTARDADGNIITRASDTGINTSARIQILGQSGTSSRRQEQDVEGFESEKVYSIRFPPSFHAQHGEMGAQVVVQWRAVRWNLFGDANRYTNSPRTAHITYTMKRF